MTGTEQPERVMVDRKALDALIEYADAQRNHADSQFLCSIAEYERSQQEFDALVDALGLPPDGGAAR